MWHPSQKAGTRSDVATNITSPKTAAVIGGGPAGLIAAEVLARAGLAVTIYDGMPSLGRKFLLAGRGGLNLTHSDALDRFLERYGAAAQRVAAAIAAFPPGALRDWCAGLGEPSFVGTSGRVFPKSFKSSPLLRAWLRRLAEMGVELRSRHRFLGFDDAGDLALDGPQGDLVVRAGAVILACGGASWPREPGVAAAAIARARARARARGARRSEDVREGRLMVGLASGGQRPATSVRSRLSSRCSSRCSIARPTAISSASTFTGLVM